MPDDSETDIEFVSQDEIDRLLNQEDATSEEDAASAASTPGEADLNEESASGENAAAAASTSKEAAESDDSSASENGAESQTDDASVDAEPETDRAADDTPDPPSAENIDLDEILEVESEMDDQPSDDESEADSPGGEDSEPASSEDTDIDELLDAETDIDDTEMEETIDRVILEDVPEAPVSKAHRHNHILALRKDFWITLALVCMLGSGFNLLLWRHNKSSLEGVEPRVLSFPVVDTAAVAGPLTFRDNPRAITLKGFLVPAPIKRKDLTYVTADVSIELTHLKAVSLIKVHAPFYRNIIYEVIKNTLRSLDKSKISEISLKIEILKALNGSVPERSVRDVNVDTFVMF